MSSPYHGGYGPCGGLGKVWVDDGMSSNWYSGGPPCPDCANLDAIAKKVLSTSTFGLRIVGVAYRIKRHPSEENPQATDLIISAPAPARHPSLYHFAGNGASLRLVGEFDDPLKEDGFILSDGTFVNRVEAAKIAKTNGQLKRPMSGTQLFSEHLW